MHKKYHDISRTIMKEIFTLRHHNQYNLRNWTHIAAPRVITVNHDSKHVRHLGSKVLETILTHKKELDTGSFIKKWKSESYPCRSC